MLIRLALLQKAPTPFLRMNPDDPETVQLKKTLSYANGYRELGMYDNALDELSLLPEKQAYHLGALQMKLAVLIDAKDWPAAVCAAKDLTLRDAGNPSNIVNLAFATRRANSLQEAKGILLAAVERFTKTAIIHYNLGCYACHEHEMEEAKEHLSKAFSINPAYLDTAKSDEDLLDLANWLDGLEFA